MPMMQQTEELAMDDLRVLAYAQHMAQTAQCDSAKRLFELFAQQETRRIDRTGATWAETDTTRGDAMKKSTGIRGVRVSFELTAEPESDVFVAGSFNDWNPTQHRMSDNPDNGHCKTTIMLPAGRHEYKFVVNGEWRVDPNCPDSVPNECGSLNSVISV